jgi:3-demethoxyubiquinol 3-hydroxylase
LLGKNAIAATTVAVEKVVLLHLEHQITELTGKDENAVKAISSIVEEETEHRDHFVVQNNIWVQILTPIVSTSTKIVIWLGLKL